MKKKEQLRATEPFRFIPLLVLIIVLGAFSIFTTVSQTYAQTNDRRAISQIIPFTDITDSTICPNGEIVQISGNVHVVGQIIQDETGDHFVIHVNFQGVRGVGQTTGNQYLVPYTFNSPSNFNIRSDSATGSATSVTSFHLISQGPDKSAPDFDEHALMHLTVNANGEVTVTIDSLTVECR